MLRRGVCHVLVTCGGEGVYWCSGAAGRWFAAPKVKPVDTVAAGDCFCGALAARFAEGIPLDEAIAFAVAAAAISVTRRGAQPSLPRRGEILRVLRLSKTDYGHSDCRYGASVAT